LENPRAGGKVLGREGMALTRTGTVNLKRTMTGVVNIGRKGTEGEPNVGSGEKRN